MTDLENLLRDRLAGTAQPPLAPPLDLSARVRRDLRRRTTLTSSASIGAVALLVAAVPIVRGWAPDGVPPAGTRPGQLTPGASASPSPSPSPSPQTGPVVNVAALTFATPPGLRIVRPVTKRDNTPEDGRWSVATDVSLAGIENGDRRGLGITVYDGTLGRMEWRLDPPGDERHTTIAGYPAKVNRFTTTPPPGRGLPSKAAVQILVKVRDDRTLLVLGEGIPEAALIAMVRDALAQ